MGRITQERDASARESVDRVAIVNVGADDARRIGGRDDRRDGLGKMSEASGDDGARVGVARRPGVARFAVVAGGSSEMVGGAGGSTYWLVMVGGGVTGGAAIWSTGPPEPSARPRVSQPISATSSA